MAKNGERIRKMPINVGKAGMTLIEVLVALALLSIVFGLVILPFTKSFDLIRRARVAGSLESAIMLCMRQIEADISRARIIFLTESPYDLQDGEVNDNDSAGRIDIVMTNSKALRLNIPLIPEDKIVTYYSRFLDSSKPRSLDPKFTNPVVLYRVEHPPTDSDGDGRYSEDPLDGLDNDGDGKIDEDPFGAPENAITPLDGTDLAGLRFWYDEMAKAIIVDIKLQKVDPTIRVKGGGKLLIRRQKRIPLDYWVEVTK